MVVLIKILLEGERIHSVGLAIINLMSHHKKFVKYAERWWLPTAIVSIAPYVKNVILMYMI